MKFSPYSFSKLSTYEQCNRKFKYNYIDKTTKSKTDITPLLKGGAVHSILEHHPLRSSHKLAPKYQHIADKFLETEMGKKYIHQNSIREFNFGILPDLTVTTYSDKKALFRGSIDYVCTIDGVLNLVDWKTGKYREPKWQSFTQLMFYGIYFFQRYSGINKIRISYVYIEHEDQENDIILERKYLFTYVKELITLIKGAESDKEFKKNPGRLCEWCEFKDYCDSDK